MLIDHGLYSRFEFKEKKPDWYEEKAQQITERVIRDLYGLEIEATYEDVPEYVPGAAWNGDGYSLRVEFWMDPKNPFREIDFYTDLDILNSPIALAKFVDFLAETKRFHVTRTRLPGGYATVTVSQHCNSKDYLEGTIPGPPIFQVNGYLGEAFQIAVAALACWEFELLRLYPAPEDGWDYKVGKEALNDPEKFNALPLFIQNNVRAQQEKRR